MAEEEALSEYRKLRGIVKGKITRACKAIDTNVQKSVSEDSTETVDNVAVSELIKSVESSLNAVTQMDQEIMKLTPEGALLEKVLDDCYEYELSTLTRISKYKNFFSTILSPIPLTSKIKSVPVLPNVMSAKVQLPKLILPKFGAVMMLFIQMLHCLSLKSFVILKVFYSVVLIIVSKCTQPLKQITILPLMFYMSGMVTSVGSLTPE